MAKKYLKDLPKDTNISNIKVRVPIKAIMLDSGFNNPSNEGYITQVMGETWLADKPTGNHTRKLNLLEWELIDIDKIEIIN